MQYLLSNKPRKWGQGHITCACLTCTRYDKYFWLINYIWHIIYASLETEVITIYLSVIQNFFFHLTEWYCQRLVFSETDSDTENNRSMWCQTHYDVADKNNNINFEAQHIDKNNNIYFEGLNISIKIITSILKVSTYR